MSEHKATGKREEVQVRGETRYVRRDDEGYFTEDQVDKGESLSRDRQRDAERGRRRSNHDGSGPINTVKPPDDCSI